MRRVSSTISNLILSASLSWDPRENQWVHLMNPLILSLTNPQTLPLTIGSSLLLNASPMSFKTA